MKKWLGFISVMVLITGCILLVGCGRERDRDDGEFRMKEPELPPLEKPVIVPPNEFLRETPTGNLKNLVPNKIAIRDRPDYRFGSDPGAYLKALLRRSKQKQMAFLPDHYYISDDGTVFAGMAPEYCGYGERGPLPGVLLVSVLGKLDDVSEFMPVEQQTTLIQLCAWLCQQHSLRSQIIVPITEVDSNAPALGANLASWFGTTQLLQTRVEQVLLEGAEVEDEGFFNWSKKEDKPSWRSSINEDGW